MFVVLYDLNNLIDLTQKLFSCEEHDQTISLVTFKSVTNIVHAYIQDIHKTK